MLDKENLSVSRLVEVDLGRDVRCVKGDMKGVKTEMMEGIP